MQCSTIHYKASTATITVLHCTLSLPAVPLYSRFSRHHCHGAPLCTRTSAATIWYPLHAICIHSAPWFMPQFVMSSLKFVYILNFSPFNVGILVNIIMTTKNITRTSFRHNDDRPLHKFPRSFQNVLQIEALQFRLGSKLFQERNQRC